MFPCLKQIYKGVIMTIIVNSLDSVDIDGVPAGTLCNAAKVNSRATAALTTAAHVWFNGVLAQHQVALDDAVGVRYDAISGIIAVKDGIIAAQAAQSIVDLNAKDVIIASKDAIIATKNTTINDNNLAYITNIGAKQDIIVAMQSTIDVLTIERDALGTTDQAKDTILAQRKVAVEAEAIATTVKYDAEQAAIAGRLAAIIAEQVARGG
jgi:hypothetical protein